MLDDGKQHLPVFKQHRSVCFDNLRQTQNRTLKGVHLVHEIVLCIVQAKVFLLHALKTDIIGGYDV